MATASLALFAACGGDDPGTAPTPPSVPAFSTFGTGALGTLPGIYFLPPLVGAAESFTGTFDPALSPVVEIVNGADQVVARFTTGGTTSSSIRVSTADEQYIVNWTNLSGAAFRVRLLVDGVELGNAALPTGQRAWPIKFRIEQGASSFVLVKVAGDSQTAFPGATLPVAPSVRFTNLRGDPIPAFPVSFVVASGNGFVSGGSQLTGGDGIATVGGWTLGFSPGPNTLTATAGNSTVTFSALAVSCAPVQSMAVNDFYLLLQPGVIAPAGASAVYFQGSTGVMYAGGLLYGTSAADVQVGYRPELGQQAFAPGPICLDRTAPYRHTTAVVTPALPATAPTGLAVTQESFAFPQAPDRGYVLLKYTFTNNGTAPITDFYSGWVADWDILYDGRAFDRVRYNAALGLGEVSEPDTLLYPARFALVPMGPSGAFSFSGWGSTIGSAKTNAEFFGLLTGGINLSVPPAPSFDIREMMGLAPVTIAPGGSSVAYFAIVGGENRTAFEANVAAARAKVATLGY